MSQARGRRPGPNCSKQKISLKLNKPNHKNLNGGTSCDVLIEERLGLEAGSMFGELSGGLTSLVSIEIVATISMLGSQKN